MTKVAIIGNPAYNPYVGSIKNLLIQEFPGIFECDCDQILDAITEALVASGNVRYGPQPNPESLFAIRQTVMHYMADAKAIPVLVPSGPKKPVSGMSIDLAEVFALKTIAALQSRVQAYYAPGMVFYIRLEDLTGYVLEDHINTIREDIAVYCNDLMKLIKVLGYDSFIKPVLESEIVSEQTYTELTNKLIDPLLAYINDTDELGLEDYALLPSYGVLKSLGWQGMIPNEQRDFYRERYQRLYPDMKPHEITMLMVRYFATTLARYQLKATCIPEQYAANHIQLNFAPPVPGIPKEMVSRRLYCRTMPMKLSKHHLPFWRGKGYLKLNGEAKPSIISWGEKQDYNNLTVTLKGNGETVNVTIDYIIEE